MVFSRVERLPRTPKTRTTAAIRQCTQAVLDTATVSFLRAIHGIRGLYSPNLRGMSARVYHFDRRGVNLNHSRMTQRAAAYERAKWAASPHSGHVPDSFPTRE